MPEAAKQSTLRAALDGKQLLMYYQPIHESGTENIMSAEALLRWRQPGGEICEGSRLTAAAEVGPDLVRLDQWLLTSACREAAQWPEGVRLNLNLSPREFEQKNLVSRLQRIMRDTELHSARVNLEITETTYIHDPADVVAMLNELKGSGFQLWLDDFGTGYSSIEHLRLFPLDGVKLPGSFVKNVLKDPRSTCIVEAVVSLAHNLGLRVVAEEVENREQLEFLRGLDCEYIQGFLFSHPMPGEEFRDKLGADSN
jgi:EAL domain-containing protein (putative c-di-GMP-specific phosphodiesterase class I)